jgi:sister chromatid cohesion protein PDS5
MIGFFAQLLPDPIRASEDLLKFAKKHDRRSYQLIRFSLAAESDYRKVYKSIVSFASSHN